MVNINLQTLILLLFFVRAVETCLKKDVFYTKYFTSLRSWCFIWHTNFANNGSNKENNFVCFILSFKGPENRDWV